MGQAAWNKVDDDDDDDDDDAETKLIPMVKNVVLTPPDYDRDIRHYEFDIHGHNMAYSPGDCLGGWSRVFLKGPYYMISEW